MGLVLGVIIPVATILIPIFILLIIGKRKNKLGRLRFGLAIMCCFFLGLVVPILATYLSVKGLMYNFGPDDPKCVTGAGVFLVSGYLINLIGVPITGVLFCLRDSQTISKSGEAQDRKDR